MQRAIELSLENMRSNKGGPFGAVVVKDGRIVGEGANQVLATNDPSAHAEVVAIREACRKLNSFQLTGCEVYSSCEPCPMCMGLIYWSRPERVYYGNTASDAARVGFDDDFIYHELGKPAQNRSLKMTQMMREQALTAFVLWAEKPDKIQY